LGKRIKIIFTLLLLWQLVLIAVGLIAFSLPAFNFWRDRVHSGEELRPEHRYAFTHAVVMWVVIPQHIPTMMATIGLFFVISNLHAVDMRRVKCLLGHSKTRKRFLGKRKSSVASVGSIRNTLNGPSDTCTTVGSYCGTNMDIANPAMCLTFDLLESMQQRLQYSCQRWQWLWLHQVVYCFCQLFISMSHVRSAFMSKDEFDLLLHFTDFFHGLFGIMALMSVMVTPALVTQKFTTAITEVAMMLRSFNVSVCEISQGVPYLQMRVKGFTIFGEPIGPATLSRFVTLIGIFGSLYIQLAAN
jgi:hypothetical protein